jgi:triacylglycerol lipase
MLLIGSLLMILAVLDVSEAQPAAPLVDICNGTYAGTYSPAFNQDIFLGMPFAKPPTGCRRLRVPESLDTAWTGIREAVALGDSCPAYYS